MNGPNKIVVRNLNVYYGRNQALKDVNLVVPADKVTALIGPPGSGKSTFLRSLNRLNEVYDRVSVTGEIIVNGEEIHRPGVDLINLRRQMGLLFTQPNPFPMSIMENVAYGPIIHGEKDRHVVEEIVFNSLTKAGLWDDVKDNLHQSARQLSPGRQQQLCLARLLAVNPVILLLDEPTAEVDPLEMIKIEEIIHHLREDYTIIIATHNMQQAARVSDYTALFLGGELIEYDITDIIFTRPHHQFTEDYITGRLG